jgi:hypothetical protein
MIFNVYAIEVNGCDGIAEVLYVAANDRQNALDTLKNDKADTDIERKLQWCDVMWLEGATYEAEKPCCINDRLCCEDGEIIY